MVVMSANARATAECEFQRSWCVICFFSGLSKPRAFKHKYTENEYISTKTNKTHGVIVVCTQLILQSIEIPILNNTNPNYSWFRNIGMKHLYKSVMHVPKSKQHVCGPVDMVVAAPLSERTQQTTVHTRLHHWCVGTTIINVDEEAVSRRQLRKAPIHSSLILTQFRNFCVRLRKRLSLNLHIKCFTISAKFHVVCSKGQPILDWMRCQQILGC